MEALRSEDTTDVMSLQVVAGASVPGMASHDQQGPSDKSLQKRTAREKKRLANEFTQAMTGSIQCLEDTMDHGTSAQKELAKQRRRMLKDVLKAATEPSSSVDDRLRYLQAKFVQLVQEQGQQDREMLTLQAQLNAAEKQAALGQADLQRANQKVDRLQQLARTLQKENKLMADEVEMRRQQIDGFKKTTQDIQEKIESHGAESNKVHQDNQELLVENHNLRSKLGDMAQLLGDTQEKLESLRTAQAQQLQAIQDKLGQQSDFLERSQELQGQMDSVIQENKLLSGQVQALDMQNKQLELLNAEYKKQLDTCRTQIKGMESSLATSSKLMKLVEKLQQDMTEHQKQTPVLMKERQLLKEQTLLLQRQVKEQADELKHSQLQKLRLEGLCRALQARLGGPASMMKDQPQALPAPDEGDTAAICRKTVQAAISAVVAQHQ